MDTIFVPQHRNWIFPPLFRQEASPELPVPETSASPHKKNVQSESQGGNSAISLENLQRETKESVPEEKSRRQKRKFTIKEESSAEQIIPPPTSWEEDTRASLGMETEEFNVFLESQGFTRQAPNLHSLFDFGVPEPKGMPRFATEIPDEYYKHSNTLRVYRNALRASATHGDIIINACDQAFALPDRGPAALAPADRVKTLDDGEMVITVDCYHPSAPVNNELLTELRTFKLPVVGLTVEILASQTLQDLQSKLHCENDFVYIAPIKHPNDVKKLDWKRFSGVHDVSTTNSTAIFIHDVVYTAEITPNYGQKLRGWVGQKLLGNQKDLRAGSLSTRLKEIPFRPGYPYLYRHSDCEHILVFTNIRRPHPTDPQVPKLYPRLTYLHNLPAIQCRVNPKHLAKFVVKDDPRLPEKLVPMCKECCLAFCYTLDNKFKDIPFGEFKLFPLVQMHTLPINSGGVN